MGGNRINPRREGEQGEKESVFLKEKKEKRRISQQSRKSKS